MFQKIAKHRANDASNDVHRPPLPTAGHVTIGVQSSVGRRRLSRTSAQCPHVLSIFFLCFFYFMSRGSPISQWWDFEKTSDNDKYHHYMENAQKWQKQAIFH